MSESSIKRDEHFQNTQRLAGSAMSALGKAMNMLLQNSDDNLDTLKLLGFLSDTGKLIAHLHNAETIARRAFIAPGFSKSVKSILDKSNRGNFLFGDNLTEKINEVNSLEKILKTLKPSLPTKKPYTSKSGSLNSKSSFTKNQKQQWTSYNQKSQPRQSMKSHQTFHHQLKPSMRKHRTSTKYPRK